VKVDTQPLLLAASRLWQEGHLPREEYEARRERISLLEGRLVTKESHVEAYAASREQVLLDGTFLAWERWRAEHQFLTLARSEAERLEAFIRFEVELLERQVALAQQRKARALAEAAQKETRA
jgi:hypothetical protein